MDRLSLTHFPERKGIPKQIWKLTQLITKKYADTVFYGMKDIDKTLGTGVFIRVKFARPT